MVAEVTPGVELLLILIAFLAGVGVTAIGPGGIFLTIALYSLTSLPAAVVAGTASATMVAAGTVGSLGYILSGELRRRSSWQVALILGAAGILGGLAGSWLNTFVSEAGFGALLGTLAAGAGAVILRQEWRGLEPRYRLDVQSAAGRIVLAALGLGIGIASGLLGVGGPVLAVPALVVLGVPLLSGIAVAQVQSVAIALFATVGYSVRGTVAWPLAALVGIPLLVGVLVGWVLARRIEPRRLKISLGLVLIALGPYLALRSAW